MYFSTFLLLILPGIISAAFFQQNLNFFGKYDFHILNEIESTSKFFEENFHPPGTNPILLESAFYNETVFYMNNKFWTSKKSPPRNRVRKITHYIGLISMMNLKLGIRIKGQPFTYQLLDSVITNMNPNYIFAHVEQLHNSEYYQNYDNHPGSAKLFLVTTTQSNSVIYIPCLVCRSKPWSLTARDTPLTTLDTHWNLINGMNLNQNYLPIYVSPFWYPIRSLSPQCGGTALQFNRFDNAFTCMVFNLCKKYNFTTVTDYYSRSFSTIYLFALTKNTQTLEFAVAKLVSESYKFVIITRFPSPMNSFEAFTSPFDSFTWIILLSSCVFFTLFITVDHFLLCSEEKKTDCHILEGVLNILFPLIGQTSDKLVQLIHCKIGGGFAWILWLFFGCYILMNNLYQGSVYSYLTVTLPPPVPKTMAQLHHSDARIITTATFTNDSIWQSVLKQLLIPQLIHSLGDNNSYSHLLTELNPRIVYDSNFGSVLISWVNNSEANTLSGEISSKETFAMFDPITEMQIKVDFLKLWGGRYIVSNSEDTSMNIFKVWLAKRNFLQPTIHRHVKQLEGSGILERWKALHTYFRGLVYTIHLESHFKSKWIRRKVSGGKEKDAWNEASPMTLNVLTFLFVIWGGMLAFGLLLFFLKEKYVGLKSTYSFTKKLVNSLTCFSLNGFRKNLVFIMNLTTFDCHKLRKNLQ